MGFHGRNPNLDFSIRRRGERDGVAQDIDQYAAEQTGVACNDQRLSRQVQVEAATAEDGAQGINGITDQWPNVVRGNVDRHFALFEPVDIKKEVNLGGEFVGSMQSLLQVMSRALV
jgi:hypothetical protein